jgi:hypothetical protein
MTLCTIFSYCEITRTWQKKAVIHFLWAEGVPGGEMHRRMSVQYGNSAMLQHIDRFNSGRTSLKGEEGARRPFTSFTDTKTERVRDMILQNRRVAIDEVAHQLQISHGSAYEIIHNRLAFHKVGARRVPEQIKELHEENHLEICKRV